MVVVMDEPLTSKSEVELVDDRQLKHWYDQCWLSSHTSHIVAQLWIDETCEFFTSSPYSEANQRKVNKGEKNALLLFQQYC